MSVLNIIHFISSFASLTLTVFLCLDVKKYEENIKKQERKNSENLRNILLDTKFRVKAFILLGLIVLNIVMLFV